MEVFKAIKEINLGEGPLEPNALYFIKAPGDDAFRMHLTNTAGVPVPLESDSAILEFDFPVPMTEWLVNHSLNKKPLVTLLQDGNVIFSEIKYVSNDTILISHLNPQAGTVVLQK